MTQETRWFLIGMLDALIVFCLGGLFGTFLVIVLRVLS